MRPSAEEVQRRVHYDPATGLLSWKAQPARGRRIGDALPMRDNGAGYLYATIDRQHIGVHRIAWAVMIGRWPDEVDHRNGDKADNRWANLREAARSQNECNKPAKRNNTSGFKGVGWHKDRGAWRAYIQKDGRHHSLGYHATPEDAHRAYAAAASRLHGEFARPS